MAGIYPTLAVYRPEFPNDAARMEETLPCHHESGIGMLNIMSFRRGEMEELSPDSEDGKHSELPVSD